MLALILASAVATPAPAATPRVHTYASLSVAPDGSRTASVEAAGNEFAPGGSSTLTIRRVADGGIVATVAKPYLSSPAWSPTGDRLAYLVRDPKAGRVALELAGPTGGAARTVTTITGEASTPKWSPDGTRIALLAVVGAHKAIGATQAGAALVGDIGALIGADEQRIDVVDVTSGATHLASPADTWVYEYDWTPDGRAFVGTAAKGNGDDNWWIAKLEAFDASSGAERVIASPPMQMNAPRVSPDGTTVAFIGGLMSDFGSVGGDVYTVPFAGGVPVDATPGYAGTFTSLTYRGVRGALTATALLADRSAIVALHPERTAADELWSAPVSIGAGGDARVAFSANGTVAASVVQDFEHAPRIATGTPRALRPVTHDNDALAPGVRARSIRWKSDGYDVQGWLLSPRTVVAGKTYPMIVQIHGGPSAAVTPAFARSGTTKDLIDAGFFVFEPNPRGSYGQGEAFTAANKRDFGGGDLRDVLAGIDAVEKVAPVDDARLGVFGHSYGGFMTMWTVTQTARFRAAVAGAGIANWISYYGENGIDTWMLPFFGGSAYDDPEIYRKLSPLTYVKNAKTPTFIYVGERDVECPAPQSLEFFHALREQHVPASLMIYEGEGHAIRQPAHSRDLTNRITGWFTKYLGA